jgi:galactokinase
VKHAFARLVGDPPDGIWTAPGRVNLIGEHTDYNDGLMLPIAIDRAAIAAGRRREDGELVFRSLQHPERDGTWLAYPRGVAVILEDEGVPPVGADVVIDSDVPEGAGLSSSAALEVAVALALTGLAGVELEPSRLAIACRRAEQEVVGVPCGVMDQLVSVHGRAGHAVLIDARTLETEAIPLDLAGSGLELAVVDTRVAHALREGGYADRRRESELAAGALGRRSLRDVSLADLSEDGAALPEPLRRRARHVVSENERVLAAADLLRSGRIGELGPLLAASHASLRDDFEVSSAELDLAVETAVAAGAVGARMTGGGFGGSAVALVPKGRLREIEASVVQAFAVAGFAPPSVWVVQPSDGARRLHCAAGS